MWSVQPKVWCSSNDHVWNSAWFPACSVHSVVLGQAAAEGEKPSYSVCSPSFLYSASSPQYHFGFTVTIRFAEMTRSHSHFFGRLVYSCTSQWIQLHLLLHNQLMQCAGNKGCGESCSPQRHWVKHNVKLSFWDALTIHANTYTCSVLSRATGSKPSPSRSDLDLDEIMPLLRNWSQLWKNGRGHMGAFLWSESSEIQNLGQLQRLLMNAPSIPRSRWVC